MEPNDKDSVLDNLLDSGLKQYGQASPRTGLETRVLANLRAKQENRVARVRPWWQAGATVALCVLAAGALFMIRKPGNSLEPRIHRSPVETAARVAPAATNPAPVQTLSAGSRYRVQVFGPEGGLPPAPLNHVWSSSLLLHRSSKEEEKLVRYIRERPHDAALMARAQAELLKQDSQPFAPLLSAGPPTDSQP